MSEEDLQKQLDTLRKKLNTAQRQSAVLKEKSALLERSYEDSRTREERTNELVMELVERQKELNLMLYRANAIIGRAQEAMALSSSEFNEMAKALPEPKQAEWSDRVSRINDLFKKTGIPDADVKPDVAFPNESAKASRLESSDKNEAAPDEDFRRAVEELKQTKTTDVEIPVDTDFTDCSNSEPWWKKMFRKD